MDSKKMIRALVIIGIIAAILGVITGLLIVKYKKPVVASIQNTRIQHKLK
ncbi:hypothetical protein [Clostridium thermobutyricum]|jgi:hypothetical protein|uniref:Uncharacterized protein n=1 Tax=Clostridium thermobutyricum TaxID=29372 RepID=N9Y1Y2_9CLOT|nr:hypothetical protein [Clostridium thermobutyricum]ENZ01837.1 hypothetical protein HMPREF1092_01071 [Clostridium thermobutyricum]